MSSVNRPSPSPLPSAVVEAFVEGINGEEYTVLGLLAACVRGNITEGADYLAKSLADCSSLTGRPATFRYGNVFVACCNFPSTLSASLRAWDELSKLEPRQLSDCESFSIIALILLSLHMVTTRRSHEDNILLASIPSPKQIVLRGLEMFPSDARSLLVVAMLLHEQKDPHYTFQDGRIFTREDLAVYASSLQADLGQILICCVQSDSFVDSRGLVVNMNEVVQASLRYDSVKPSQKIMTMLSWLHCEMTESTMGTALGQWVTRACLERIVEWIVRGLVVRENYGKSVRQIEDRLMLWTEDMLNLAVLSQEQLRSILQNARDVDVVAQWLRDESQAEDVTAILKYGKCAAAIMVNWKCLRKYSGGETDRQSRSSSTTIPVERAREAVREHVRLE